MPTYTTRILVSLLAGASVVATAATTRGQTAPVWVVASAASASVAATPRL